MTDTDKYEGREALRQYLSSASIDLRMKPHFETYENLLAEVKRLREQIQLLHDTWFADAEMASDVDERMTTLLKEMIE